MKRAKRDATNKKNKNIVCQEHPYNSVLIPFEPLNGKSSNGYLNFDYDNNAMKQTDENLVTNQNLRMILICICLALNKHTNANRQTGRQTDLMLRQMLIFFSS